MIRLIKKILGFCENEGCMHIARQSLVLKDSHGNIKEVHVCNKCTMKLYERGTRYEWGIF